MSRKPKPRPNPPASKADYIFVVATLVVTGLLLWFMWYLATTPPQKIFN